MAAKITNHTISLANHIATSSIEDIFSLGIISTINAIHPKLSHVLSMNELVVYVILHVVGVAVFTRFRSIIYKYMYKQYKSKQLNEIHILTLIICLVQHLELVGALFFNTLIIILGNDFSNVIMSGYCTYLGIWFKTVHCMWAYSIVGSLGIAVYRIMLIRYDMLVKYAIGTKRLMGIILLSEFVLVLFLVGMMSTFNPFSNPLMPSCVFNIDMNIMDLLDTYRQSLGYDANLDRSTLVKQTAVTLVLALELIELVIYVVFFRHIYKHDNDEKIKKLLGVDEVKRRNIRNGLSFFSLFCSFFIKIVFFILVLVFTNFTTSESKYVILAVRFLRPFSLVTMAIIEVSTSSQLKAMMSRKNN